MRVCFAADDLRASREMMRTWFSMLDYECKTFSGGTDTWEAILESPPDLVVADIEMPRGSGLDLLSAIRNHSDVQIRTLPVIMISGLVDAEIARIAEDFKATCLLPKPLDMKQFEEVIDQIESQREWRSNTVFESAFPIQVATLKIARPSAMPAVSPKLRRMARRIQESGSQLSP
ncbi:Nitrogen assimilation regulatory protein [Novipirellula aureliae]|uniref:Nitrogen assimilation regulatory protein n=1 Tax=Novipirellula aureliae TaxID=2527966 RepID=A0A5C6DRQ4_9BACT|nr:response regulator [Novipirellula aureliae]TWU37696.1 Nitrogen assimilation regulatory protein [Novipirellula aureliae]